MINIIYGIHTIEYLLNNKNKKIIKVYVCKQKKNLRINTLLNKLKKKFISIQMVSMYELNNKFKNKVHQGIVAIINKKKNYKEKDIPNFLKKKKKILLLILDKITDPHNLGACLRCADAAGVSAVIVPRNNSAKLNSTVYKVASGAAETVPLIQVTNLVRTIKLLKMHNIWIIGTTDKKNTNYYFNTKMNIPLALIFGSEGTGIRRLVLKYCDELISIPMIGQVTSLNVSVAVGICLFEVIRQRNIN